MNPSATMTGSLFNPGLNRPCGRQSLPRRFTALLVGTMVCATQGAIAAGSSDDALRSSEIGQQVEQLKGHLLDIQGHFQPSEIESGHIYLHLDDDLLVSFATLRIEQPGATDPITVRFETSRSHLPTLSRASIPRQAAGQHECQLTIGEVTRPGHTVERTLACELELAPTEQTPELMVARKWLGGSSVSTRYWPLPGKLDAPERAKRNDDGFVSNFTSAVAGLSNALDAAITSRPESDPVITAADGQRDDRLVPALRLEIARCHGNPWNAMFQLRRYREAHGTTMPATFWSAYARCAIRVGILDEARLALDRLRKSAPNSLEFHRTALRVADAEYSRGEIEAALTRLNIELAQIPDQIATQWRDLLSRLLLDRQRYTDALVALSEGRHLETAGVYLEMREAFDLHYSMRMNYAYALMKTGQDDAALAVLNRVGQSRATTPVTRGLRARANAKLGWHFLQEGFGATAVRIFHRIPIDGPYSDQAILGMGWAMLAPKGEAQPLPAPPGFGEARSDPPVTAMKSLLRDGTVGCDQYLKAASEAHLDCVPSDEFARANFSDDTQLQLKRALVFWNQLIEKRQPNAATVEATLAAADAYARLGDKRRGQKLYERADQMAEQISAKLDRFQTTLGAAESSGHLTPVGSTANGQFRYPINTAIDSGHAPIDMQEWLTSRRINELRKVRGQAQALASSLRRILDSPVRKTSFIVPLSAVAGGLHTAERRIDDIIRDDSRQRIEQLSDHYRRYQMHARLRFSELSANFN